MIIRDATERDLAALCALHTLSWQATYAGMVPDRFLSEEAPARIAAKWAALPAAPDQLFLCEQEGHPVGFLFLQIRRPDGAYVDNLHVARGHAGHGIGRALMLEAARRAQSAGVPALWLTVLIDNHPARRFYLGLGGQEGAHLEEEMLGQPVRSVRVDWPDLTQLARVATPA